MEWFAKRRFGDVAAEAARKWGDHQALVFEGQRWTHAQVSAEVDRAAKALIAAGVSVGDHVGVWLVNRPEWVFLQHAIPRVGAVTVGLNTRYRTDDVAYTVDQADCSVLIAADRSGPVDYGSMLAQVMPDLPKVQTLVMLGDDLVEGAVGWDAFLAAGDAVTDEELVARAESVDPDQPALIIFTSGTTSLPKGAVHTHRVLRNSLERAEVLGHTSQDVHMSYLPLFHAFGYAEVSLMASLTGASQILTEAFVPDEVLDLAAAEGATILHGFDTHWADLIRAQQARPRDLQLRLGTLAAGQDSSTAVAYQAQDVFCPTVSGWGMSESWPFTSVSHPSHTAEQRSEASGYPMVDLEFKIIDPESGRELPTDTPGELLFRGYCRTEGYYNKPEATAEAIDADGWLHSGDMVRIRPDGHLVFMGRNKDMLKVGGENMAPAEIEGRLSDLDGVVEVAVVGYPDPRLGEVPVAYVVAAPGAEITLDTLESHLRGRVASFKIPRHIQVVEELPMTSSGKVRKVELREMILETLGDPNHA